MRKIVVTVALSVLALGGVGCTAPATSVMPAVRTQQNIAGALPGAVTRTPASDTQTRSTENIAGALPG